MSSALRVRRSVAADWPALKALRLAALLDAPTAFGVSHAEALHNPDSQWLARAAGSGPGTFFMAFDGEQAIGMAAAVRAGDAHIGLIAMWVAPGWRGGDHGVARRLVDAVKDHAAGAEITLEVAPTNLRAVAFYERQGFVFEEHTERLASHPDIELRRMRHRGAGSASASGPA